MAQPLNNNGSDFVSSTTFNNNNNNYNDDNESLFGEIKQSYIKQMMQSTPGKPNSVKKQIIQLFNTMYQKFEDNPTQQQEKDLYFFIAENLVNILQNEAKFAHRNVSKFFEIMEQIQEDHLIRNYVTPKEEEQKIDQNILMTLNAIKFCVVDHPEYFKIIRNLFQQMSQNQNKYKSITCKDLTSFAEIYFNTLSAINGDQDTIGADTDDWIFSNISIVQAVEAFAILLNLNHQYPLQKMMHFVVFFIIIGILLIPSNPITITIKIYMDIIKKKKELAASTYDAFQTSDYLVWKEFIMPYHKDIKENINHQTFDIISKRGL